MARDVAVSTRGRSWLSASRTARFLALNLSEIQTDRALQLYGAALALSNALTAVYWLVGEFRLPVILSPDLAAVCWPFWEGCQSARVVSSDTLNMLVLGLFIASLINAFGFASGQWTATSYVGLLLLAAIKYFGILQDFRLTLNHHYMTLWVLVVFAFVGNKRRNLAILLGLFYFWAAILKLVPGSEWLTGAAFYGHRPLGLPQSAIPLACAYVIVLEFFGSFGLVFTRRAAFLLVFAQFILFHIASFWVVGFFYPILMFLLLSVFVLTRLIPAPTSSLPQTNFLWSWSSGALILLFSIAQLFPRAFPGDPTITGEGRVFALSMFDAPVECRASLTYEHSDRQIRIPLVAPYLTTRVWCDPIVYMSLAKNFCQRNVERGLGSIGLRLETKKGDEALYRRVIDVRDACSASVSYSMLHHNWWIQVTR